MKSNKIEPNEQGLLNQILDYLLIRQILPIHHRTIGNIYFKDGQRHFGTTRKDQKGAPDILFCYQGEMVALEVKTSIGVISPDQKAWRDKFISHPNLGRYIVTRCLEDVENILKNLTIT